MSVSSAISLPSIVPDHGVSGAGLSTTVLPAASAGPSLAMLRYSGKFHGVIAVTTPTASRSDQAAVDRAHPVAVGHALLVLVRGRLLGPVADVAQGDFDLHHVRERDRAAGLLHDSRRAAPRGPGPIASASCSADSAGGRRGSSDHVVSSNARRAAPIAASTSAAPGVGDLADVLLGRGLTFAKVAPPVRVDELPVDQHSRLVVRRGRHRRFLPPRAEAAARTDKG